jgi:Sulfotransferase domain
MRARRAAGRLLAPVRGLMSRGERMVPGYLVVGTKRGGSTSIARWISQHPDVAPCRTKKGTHYFDVNFGRGWDWYLSAFETASPQWQTTGEASPYYMFHPLAPERIAAALPEVRIIVSLREPVSRAWSHHQYESQMGYEDKGFEEAIDLEPSRLRGEEDRMRNDPAYESFAHRHHTYLQRGHYAEQLELLHEHFSPDQVLVLRSESMFSDPHGELDKVWKHLGLAPVTLAGLERLKATHAPLAISPALRQRLVEYYRPWNQRLATLPGVGFEWDEEPIKGIA